MHHWAACLLDIWLFLVSLTYFKFHPFASPPHFSPTYPCSLHPRFFISTPLTAPWHSKALLPSLTLFHGPADDNNWFENRRQWNTRIIPSSYPPPLLPAYSTHPARASLLCVVPSVSRPQSFFLSLVLCCIIALLFRPHLSVTAFKLLFSCFKFYSTHIQYT